MKSFENINDCVRPDYDGIIKLNTYWNKIAIQYMYQSIFGKPLKCKDIKISDEKSLLIIKGKKILCWDRHHHYTHKKYFMYSNYLWLRSIEDTLINTAKKI